MRINLIFLAFMLLHFTPIKAQDFTSRSSWQQARVSVDGRSNEWEKPLNFYSSEGGLTYTISNDSNFIYLCFNCNNGMKAAKLMRAGWDIELSSKEKARKFDVSISFPGKKHESKEEPKEDYKANRTESFSDKINNYILHLTGISGSGFKTQQGEIKLNSENGIQIAIGEENPQNLIYEMAIPFSELMDTKLLQYNEQFKLKVQIKGLDNPVNNGGGNYQGGGMNSMNGNSGMRGAGGGGMRGGGQGMTRNYPADRNLMFEKVSFKLKFNLSSKKE